ncbi:uncharacterized protein BXZ73DRAFT_104511 [Epithele typhae]|uniref:uncharacterized protein n=1 Tax=Epithele typhae TaxID=378194 RepID=UPI002008475B|nr:uncharacterized protein BXZ73DRAFT_104511 [Epithele typhae]KAH9921222.1 hypothetical protein BXZ73DRAFT_104511 [Epithele typhae]
MSIPHSLYSSPGSSAPVSFPPSQGTVSLNEDVLHAIASFLDPKHALALSCACKAAYRAAISHVHTRITISPRAILPAEHIAADLLRYMLGRGPMSYSFRANTLRHISFSPNNGDQVKHMVMSLIQILEHAPNVLSIDTDVRQFSYDWLEKFSDAVGQIPALEDISLTSLGVSATSFLSRFLASPKLAKVSLSFRLPIPRLDALIAKACVHRVHSVLTSLSSVHTLKLAIEGKQWDTSELPRDVGMPSVRHFHLYCPSPGVAAGIIPFFPNLDTLFLRVSDPIPDPICASLQGPWPTIRQLTTYYPLRLQSGGPGTVGRVERLVLGHRDKITDEYTLLRLVSLLSVFRPTGLEFTMDCPKPFDTFTLYSALIAAPQLRSLHLTINLNSHLVSNITRQLLPALKSLPLVYLGLHFESDVRVCGTWVQHPELAAVRAAQGRELNRLWSLPYVPAYVAQELPSLRVVRVGPCFPGGHATLVTAAGWHDSGTSKGVVGEEDARVDAQYVEKVEGFRRQCPRDDRWWWVEDPEVGRKRELGEMLREDGERARRIIEGADFDPERSLKGFFVEKCRYPVPPEN